MKDWTMSENGVKQAKKKQIKYKMEKFNVIIIRKIQLIIDEE